MRFSLDALVNAVAWAVMIALIGVAFVMVETLGPFGLILLGLLTLFVCTSINLREDMPAWGVQVFKARIERHASPERRRAEAVEQEQVLAPLRFYRWCGLVLLVAGLIGFAWQRMN